MATVRFSQELKDAIIANAKKVFEKQVQAAKDARPPHSWGNVIYDKMFGHLTPALNAVPQEFLHMVDYVEIQRVGSLQCGLRFDLTTPRAWSREFKETDLAKKSNSYGSDIDLKDNLAWGEFFADVKRWKDGVQAAEQKRNDFVHQVNQIIEAHATLAPALKMWPALWDLVPEQYKEKHKEIKVREKREVEVDVNLGALTAAVTFNKLTR